MSKNFFITTAISYPNGPPHMGHAYETIATDVIARFRALDGDRVMFLTGTDDHGQKIFRAARDEGISPNELTDRLVPQFKDMGPRLGCKPDAFIRTSEERHHRAVADIWKRMEKAGDIYKGTYEGWYSVRDEAFYGEDELRREDGAPRAPTGSPVEWIEEESYFFRLSKYQTPLLKHYQKNPEFIAPESRRNEMIRFVEGGLEDLSISRTSFDWGVPVPDDPAHVVYVWVDALTNYMTAIGYPDVESGDFRDFWPADYHIIGKDITRFHTVYWPAFLMSAGLAIPKRVFSHGFLTVKGEKMSKSVGNVLDPFELAETYGVDQLRYFFMREVSFGSDGSYSNAAITNRINADLANDLGNLAQRSLSMIARECGGILPKPGEFSSADHALLAEADALIPTARVFMEDLKIHQMLTAGFDLVAGANRYFAEQAPWVLSKSDRERMATVLYVTAESLRQAALATMAVMPVSCGRLLDMLAVPEEKRNFAAAGEVGRLVPGGALPPPVALFPKEKKNQE